MDTVSQEAHSQEVVALAVKVLYLRNTLQIEELMRFSSISIQQQWDFLGPTVDRSQPVQSTLFNQVDEALQWQADSIGEYIRNEHFMPELTEEQKDHLCAENVVYEYTDHLSLHAYAPFAQQNDGTLVVDLVWDEDVGGWAYFNTKVIEATIDELKTSKKFIGISKTTAGARDALIRLADSNSHKEKQGCSDDDYWGQFEGPEAPSSNDNADLDKESVDSYWDKYGDNSDGDSDRDTDKDKEIERQESRLTIGVLPDLESKELVVRSIRLSLAAAASSARAAGVLEAGFLEMAHLAFNASQ